METAQPGTEGPELLFGCNKNTTKEDILASIPPRPVVDTLVARDFNAMDMAPGIFHSLRYLLDYGVTDMTYSCCPWTYFS